MGVVSREPEQEADVCGGGGEHLLYVREEDGAA